MEDPCLVFGTAWQPEPEKLSSSGDHDTPFVVQSGTHFQPFLPLPQLRYLELGHIPPEFSQGRWYRPVQQNIFFAASLAEVLRARVEGGHGIDHLVSAHQGRGRCVCVTERSEGHYYDLE